MEIVYKDQVAVASACLEAKLNRGRMSQLHSALDDIWDGSNLGRHYAVAAVVDGEYVGCATYTKRSGLVQVYVKEEHRRKGIGSSLITALEERTGVTRTQFNARPDKSVEPFFDKNRIIYYPDDIPLSIKETEVIIENPYKAAAIMRKRRREYRRNWLERLDK